MDVRKKAEHWRIDNVVLEKAIESPLDCKESILKEISPEYLLEGLILKLKLQYIGHLMWRTDSVEKTFMLGKIEGRRGRDEREWDGWMASLTWWTWPWLSSRGADGQGSLVGYSPWGCTESDMTEWLTRQYSLYLKMFNCFSFLAFFKINFCIISFYLLLTCHLYTSYFTFNNYPNDLLCAFHF